MSDIVITEFIDDWAVDDLRRDFTVHYDPTLVERPDEIALVAASSPALIVRNRTQIRGPVLAACKALKVIGRLGVGLDNIDLDECARRAVLVCPATGANAVAVAEYVIAAILVAFRDVWRANAAVLAGTWPRNELMLGEASGKRLGLVGFGAIARAVARRARALEMEMVGLDPAVGAGDPAWAAHGVARVEWPALLETSDIISLHVPLTPQTRNLFDAAAFARMKQGAVLINTARGGIVEEPALAEALKAGKLGAAVLDVYASEPVAVGSVLAGVPRLYLTPHIAGVTAEANARVSTLTVANVRRALKGPMLKGSA